MIDSTLKAYATRCAGALAVAAVLALPLALSTKPSARATASLPDHVSGVARVIDGDTISIGETRIRLEGIDAPETSQTCARRWLGTWACGQAAADELGRMLDGHHTRCDARGVDKYDRILGTCFIDGRDVNAEMVRRGLAWAFVKYSTTYVSVEAEARAQKIGIWQGQAQPPWDYRHQRWSSVEDTAPAGCAIKGNVTKNGRIYHMPWSPWYDQIRVEPDKCKRWFCTEAEALAAGWRPVQIR